MNENPNEVAAIARFARAQWPVVLAAVVAGAIAAGAWGVFRAPDPGFVATQRVRVATGVVGVPNVPTVDTVISAVSSPSVRESAAASIGLEPGALGAVTAAIDGKNTSVVVVSARRSSSDQATKAARAVAEAARERVLTLVDPNLEYQRSTLAAQGRRLPELKERLAALQAKIADAKTADLDRVLLEQAVTDVETLIYTAEDRGDTAQLALSQTERFAMLDGDTAVTRGANTGYLLSSVIRGVLLGLLAGLGVAWVRHRSRGGAARG